MFNGNVSIADSGWDDGENEGKNKDGVVEGVKGWVGVQRELWVGLIVADDIGCDVGVVDTDASRAGGDMAIASSNSRSRSHWIRCGGSGSGMAVGVVIICN